MSVEPVSQPFVDPEILQSLAPKLTIAPPFSGWTRIRTPTPYGFWTAVNTNANIGEVVMQMGRQGSGNSTYRVGSLLVGWQKTVNAGPEDTFFARFAAGPVTLRHNGGYLSTQFWMELRKPGANRQTSTNLWTNRTAELALSPPVAGQYTLMIYAKIRSFYWGHANPYAEIIGRIDRVQREVQRPGPFSGEGLEAMTSGPLELDLEARQKVEEEALALEDQLIEEPEGDAETVARTGSSEFGDS